jgi:hypothetical protein
VDLNPKYAKLLAFLGGVEAYRHGVSEWSQEHPAIVASYGYGCFLSGAAMGWLLAVLVAALINPWKWGRARG